jgi:hypothetical protein
MARTRNAHLVAATPRALLGWVADGGSVSSVFVTRSIDFNDKSLHTNHGLNRLPNQTIQETGFVFIKQGEIERFLHQ